MIQRNVRYWLARKRIKQLRMEEFQKTEVDSF